MPHALVNKNLLPRERERGGGGIPDNAFSEECTGIFLEILLHYIADTYLGSLPASGAGFNNIIGRI